MILITGHCFLFDIKIMYVPQKLNGTYHFESIRINISDEYFKVLVILF